MAYNPINNTFTTLADLAQQVGTDTTIVQVSGGTTFNDGNGGSYFWDPLSTATADGVKIIQVIGVSTGRWMRSKSSNYSTFPISFTATLGLGSTYTVNHGLSFTPTQIHIQPTNAAAASQLAYVPNATINSTTFQIVFIALPTLAPMTFNILAIRGN